MRSEGMPKIKKKWSFKLLQTQDRIREDGSCPVALVLRFCKQRSITTLNLMALPEQWDKEFERYNLKKKKQSLWRPEIQYLSKHIGNETGRNNFRFQQTENSFHQYHVDRTFICSWKNNKTKAVYFTIHWKTWNSGTLRACRNIHKFVGLPWKIRQVFRPEVICRYQLWLRL